MGSRPGQAGRRPLTRSLEPLAGESLAGYLLRTSCRLRISPLHLARLTGCTSDSSAVIRRLLLLDLDVPCFALATQLSSSEAGTLTFASWADRYPPIKRSRTGPGWPAAPDDWLFNAGPRYCPGCLAGDGSPIQQQYGGPWKKYWHLPIAFACPQHHQFLREGCPQPHPPSPDARSLIAFPSQSALHPAQCRQPRQPGNGTGQHRSSCGTRFDQPGDDDLLRPSPGILDTQQGMLALLSPQHPAEDAVRAFTDLRVITALLCASWPLGQDLIDPAMTPAVTEHIRQPGAGTRQALDRPPKGVIATAALLTAAARLLKAQDLPQALAQHLQASWPGRSSRAPWARILTRHQDTCSPLLLQAAEPAVRSYRRAGGPHGPRAPARAGGYRAEHIPALLEQHWHDQHLASLGYHPTTTIRRAGAILLVQWASGGSQGDAASYLGIRPGRSQHYSFGPDLARWLRENGSEDFTPAMRNLAAQLDDTPALINYQRRRQAMREWCLDPGTWQEITSRLPPVPGPFQPILDDRKRQEASAFIWAHITQGEPRFAPRPIEARQPEPVRKDWARYRSTTWHKLACPGRFTHYTELRKLLIEHASHLARGIDNGDHAHAPPT